MRPCLGVDGQRCPRLSPGSRCTPCQRIVDNRELQAKRGRRPYTTEERKRRAAVVAQWRDEYGDVCPGWQRDPHPAPDLTADHITSVGAGGPEDGPLAVLCASCNGRKGAR